MAWTSVTVASPNFPPTASLSAGSSFATPGGTIDLTGSYTDANAGQDVRATIRLLGVGPSFANSAASGQFTILGASGAQVPNSGNGSLYRSYTVPGGAQVGDVYWFRTEVNDQNGGNTMAWSSVTINSPPTASLSAGSSFAAPGGVIDLTGAYSDANAGQDVRATIRLLGVGPSFANSSQSGQFTILGASGAQVPNNGNGSLYRSYSVPAGAQAGDVYWFRTEVNDQNGGNTMAWSSVTIQVAGPQNVPPTASLSASSGYASPDSSINLTGTYTDQNSEQTVLASIRFLGVGEDFDHKVDTGTFTPLVPTGAQVLPGAGSLIRSYLFPTTAQQGDVYWFRTEANDQSGGNTMAWASVTVNTPPVGSLSISQAFARPNDVVTLTGTYGDTDPDQPVMASIRLLGKGSSLAYSTSSGVFTPLGQTGAPVFNPGNGLLERSFTVPGNAAPGEVFWFRTEVNDQNGGNHMSWTSLTIEENVPGPALSSSSSYVVPGGTYALTGSYGFGSSTQPVTAKIVFLGLGSTYNNYSNPGDFTPLGQPAEAILTPGSASFQRFHVISNDAIPGTVFWHRLEAVDSSNNTSMAWASFRVNTPPEAILSGPSFALPGETITLTGEYVDVDVGQVALASIRFLGVGDDFKYSSKDGLFERLFPTGVQVAGDGASGLIEREYRIPDDAQFGDVYWFRTESVDSAGGKIKDWTSVTIAESVDGNDRPIVSISPSSGTFSPSGPITISVAVKNEIGSISSVRLERDGVSIPLSGNLTYVETQTSGQRVYRAFASDSFGLEGQSQQIELDFVSQPPVGSPPEGRFEIKHTDSEPSGLEGIGGPFYVPVAFRGERVDCDLYLSDADGDLSKVYVDDLGAGDHYGVLEGGYPLVFSSEGLVDVGLGNAAKLSFKYLIPKDSALQGNPALSGTRTLRLRLIDTSGNQSTYWATVYVRNAKPEIDPNSFSASGTFFQYPTWPSGWEPSNPPRVTIEAKASDLDGNIVSAKFWGPRPIEAWQISLHPGNPHVGWKIGSPGTAFFSIPATLTPGPNPTITSASFAPYSTGDSRFALEVTDSSGESSISWLNGTVRWNAQPSASIHLDYPAKFVRGTRAPLMMFYSDGYSRLPINVMVNFVGVGEQPPEISIEEPLEGFPALLYPPGHKQDNIHRGFYFDVPASAQIGDKYWFRINATDPEGGQKTTYRKIEVVDPANAAPEIESYSVSSYRVEQGQPVQITVVASDPDGSIDRVELYKVGSAPPVQTVSGSLSSYVFNLTSVDAAKNSYFVRAYDNRAAYDESSLFEIEWTEPVSSADINISLLLLRNDPIAGEVLSARSTVTSTNSASLSVRMYLVEDCEDCPLDQLPPGAQLLSGPIAVGSGETSLNAEYDIPLDSPAGTAFWICAAVSDGATISVLEWTKAIVADLGIRNRRAPSINLSAEPSITQSGQRVSLQAVARDPNAADVLQVAIYCLGTGSDLFGDERDPSAAGFLSLGATQFSNQGTLDAEYTVPQTGSNDQALWFRADVTDGLTTSYDWFSVVVRSSNGGTDSPSIPNSGDPASIVGTLPGDLSVDNRGSANYSIPLDIVSGRAGLQPELSISYNSQGGNGAMGIGFDLSGQSSIVRGRNILARDDTAQGVTNTDSDKLYLDGKRLILISGSYLKSGSVYRTEVDSFGQVFARGQANQAPDYFEIHTKTGRILYYGKFAADSSDAEDGGADGIQPLSWHLKRVEDLSNNFIAYHYEDVGNGEHLLTRIDYTGHVNDDCFARILLQYEEREDKRSSYQAGIRTDQAHRLKRIAVQYNESGFQDVREYVAIYEYAPVSKVSRLDSVYSRMRDSATSPWQKLPASEFQWSQYSENEHLPKLQENVLSGNVALLPDPTDYNGEDQYFADVTGDGRPDLIYHVDDEIFNVHVNNGTGFNNPVQWTNGGAINPIGSKYNSVKTGDFNGDGLADILVAHRHNPDDSIHIYYSDGTKFVNASKQINSYTAVRYPKNVWKDYDNYGDGKTRWTSLHKAENGFTSRITVSDYNGDGRDDILLHNFMGEIHVSLATDSGFGSWKIWETGLAKTDVRAELANVFDITSAITRIYEYFTVSSYPGDYNGDGLQDYAWIEHESDITSFKGFNGTEYGMTETSYRSYVVFSTGTEFTNKRGIPGGQQSTVIYGLTGFTLDTYDDHFVRILPGDFNGDGISDFITMSHRTAGWGLVLGKGGDPDNAGFESIYYPFGVLGSRLSFTPYGEVTNRDFWKSVIAMQPLAWTFDDTGAEDDLRQIYLQQTSISGDNTFAYDVNHDGLTDIGWVRGPEIDAYGSETLPADSGWWVSYANGRGFSPPVKILDYDAAGLEIAKPYAEKITGHELDQRARRIPSPISIKPIDLDGDGLTDWMIEPRDRSLNQRYIAISSSPKGDLLAGVTNGLGRLTEIDFLPITDPNVYVKGSGTKYPIVENQDARHVVSAVRKDYGGPDKHTFNYVYSGARTDLSGRGFLGYHSFITHDTVTDLFSYQFLAQSFPMTGLSKREQTFKKLGESSLRLLDWTDNDVTCDLVIDPLVPPGEQRLGSFFPYSPRSRSRKWEYSPAENVAASPKDGEAVYLKVPTDAPYIDVTVRTRYDEQTNFVEVADYPIAPSGPFNPQDNKPVGLTAKKTASLIAALPGRISYGNVAATETNYGEGYLDESAYTYYAPYEVDSETRLPGLVKTASSTAKTPITDPDSQDPYNYTSPVKTYTYHTTGQVKTETIDSIDSSLDLTTSYDYYSQGVLKSTTVATASSANLASGHPDYIEPRSTTYARYDSTWRFPTQVTNPLGHWQETRYNPVLGLPEKSWDINRGSEGRGMHTAYDALGRAVSVADLMFQEPYSNDGGSGQGLKNGLETKTKFGWTLPDYAQVSSGSECPSIIDGVTVVAPGYVQAIGGQTAESVYFTCVDATLQPHVVTYYDRLARPIRVVKDGFGSQKTAVDTIYDKYSRVVAVSQPYASAFPEHWSLTEYDDLGRVLTVSTPAFGSGGGSSASYTTTTNTYRGRLSHVSIQAPGLVAQNTLSLTNPKGQAIAIWNADRTAAVSLAAVAGYAYDGSDAPLAGASLRYDLDGAGRMRRTRLLGTPAVVKAAYDPLGNQLSLDDPDKGSWSYRYNALGQLTWQRGANDDLTTTAYDKLGRQLTRLTGRDSLNHPAETLNEIQERSEWWYWDKDANAAAHRVAQAGQGWIGSLQRAENHVYGPGDAYEHRVGYLYTGQGQLDLELHHVDEKYYYFYSKYDAASRLTGRDYHWRPSGKENDYQTNKTAWNCYQVRYVPDTESYLTQVTGQYVHLGQLSGAQQTWWEASGTGAYDLLDRPVSFVKGAGHATVRTYDPASQLLSGIATGSIQNNQYVWDGYGNLASRTVGSQKETFGYDELNRLVERGVGLGAKSLYAQYDDLGNIISKRDVGDAPSGTYVYHPEKIHAVTNAWDYDITYDASGNMATRRKTGAPDWNFDWTAFDKPRSIDNGSKGSAFRYDASRQRAVHLRYDKSGGSVRFDTKKVYVGSNLEIDFTNRAAPAAVEDWGMERVRVYIDGPDGRTGAAEFEPAGEAETAEAYVYHQDHLGSVEAITEYGVSVAALADDRSGKDSVYSYDPWGQRRNPLNWSGAPATTADGGQDDLTPRGFTDHEMLDDLGLVHMNGRIYDPLLGRFLSCDPFVQAPSNLQSFNRYTYGWNNPLLFTDPSGYKNFTNPDGSLDSSRVTGFVDFMDLMTTDFPVAVYNGVTGIPSTAIERLRQRREEAYNSMKDHGFDPVSATAYAATGVLEFGFGGADFMLNFPERTYRLGSFGWRSSGMGGVEGQTEANLEYEIVRSEMRLFANEVKSRPLDYLESLVSGAGFEFDGSAPVNNQTSAQGTMFFGVQGTQTEGGIEFTGETVTVSGAVKNPLGISTLGEMGFRTAFMQTVGASFTTGAVVGGISLAGSFADMGAEQRQELSKKIGYNLGLTEIEGQKYIVFWKQIEDQQQEENQ